MMCICLIRCMTNYLCILVWNKCLASKSAFASCNIDTDTRPLNNLQSSEIL